VNLDKIATIESNNNPTAHNKKSGAYGTFQITKIALADFNRENGTRIKFKNLKEECEKEVKEKVKTPGQTWNNWKDKDGC
jgi:hypothetical protein